MKETIIMLAIMLMFSTPKVNAQARHQIRAGYSDATALTMGSAIGQGFVDAITAGLAGAKIKDAKSNSLGGFEIGYRYQLTKSIKAGGDVYYLRTDKTFQLENNSTKTSTKSTRRTNYIMILPMAEFSYIRTPLLNFYGSGGAGAIFSETKEIADSKSYKARNVDFGFQINPVGLSVGKKLAGFLELGYGHKGIVTVGLSYKVCSE